MTAGREGAEGAVLRNARIAGGSDPAAPSGLVDIRIEGGRIATVRPVPAAPGSTDGYSGLDRAGKAESPAVRGGRPRDSGDEAERGGIRSIDLGGRVVAPAFVEPHLHLDKALLGTPAGGATLAEAIAATAERKAGFTTADVRARAGRMLAMALRAGTTAIRAQTEVDPGVGLLGVEVMSALAEEHASWLEFQIAVFPQEGILSRPGTLELMRTALRRPGTVVGGCPYSEASVTDARAHVDQVLDLAVEFGVLADLHLDLADDLDDERFTLAEYVARATAERGLEGRVALGHVTTLAAMPSVRRGRVLDALAAADIGVVVLPATDLYLMGRADESNARRGVAPLAALREHGVRTAISSNNVRNAFTPTGRADPLDIALLLARVSFVSEDADFAELLRLASGAGARILNPDARHAVEPGARADLVVFDSFDPATVVVDQPPRHLVLARGRPVYRQERLESWALELASIAEQAPFGQPAAAPAPAPVAELAG